MGKISIYHVDSLPGGEVRIEEQISPQYRLDNGFIYNQQDEIKGEITEGRHFSKDYNDLELHIFDDPVLEKIFDDCRVRNSHSQAHSPS